MHMANAGTWIIRWEDTTMATTAMASY